MKTQIMNVLCMSLLSTTLLQEVSGLSLSGVPRTQLMNVNRKDLENRRQSCGQGMVPVWSSPDQLRPWCMGRALFGVGSTIALLSSPGISDVAHRVATWVIHKAGFGEDKPVEPTKRGDGTRIEYENDREVEVYDLRYDDSAYSATGYSDQEDSPQLTYARKTHDEDGGVDNLAMSFSVPNQMKSNKRQGTMEVHISYGTPPGHSSTELSHSEIAEIVTGALTHMAYDLDSSGGCGEMNNGGKWDGYLAITTGGDNWGDCTGWVQDNQANPAEF